MTQLILDGIVLPESVKDGYAVENDFDNVELEMISRRTVRELRKPVWKIRYQYGYFDTETRNALISACEKGKNEPITCGFIIPENEDMQYSEFWVETYKRPVFAWSRDGKPLWMDFSVELKEVRPHD